MLKIMKSLTWLVLTWRDQNGVDGSSSRLSGFGNFVSKNSPFPFIFPYVCLLLKNVTMSREKYIIGSIFQALWQKEELVLLNQVDLVSLLLTVPKCFQYYFVSIRKKLMPNSSDSRKMLRRTHLE